LATRPVAGLLGAIFIAGLLAGPASGASGDPHRSKQWNLDKIKAEQAWAVSDGTGVTVAVLDTGVDLAHPDLKGKLTSPGADFVDPAGADGANDEDGHGTHVAGIIAAAAGNGVGVSGAAPGARILPVRVLSEEGGGGTVRQIANGIRYAADSGAQVINLSLSFDAGSDVVFDATGSFKPIHEAIEHAWNGGAVIVVAAGNDSAPLCTHPSSSKRALCIGATDKNDGRAYYSNSDATLTRPFLVAPGGNGLTCAGAVFSTVLTTLPKSSCSPEGGYDGISGTSMAAPHVSAVAALLVATGLGNQEVVDCLKRTTDDLGAPGRDPVFGYGRVNALKAVTGC
jgi:serine protease